jgi:5-formyltetrahydrofolate cyclo-ligase
MKSKKEIREEIRQKLKRQGKKERDQRSGKIYRLLLGLPQFRDSTKPLIYLSLPEEVDTLPLIGWCLKEGKKVVVPAMPTTDQAFELRQITDLAKDTQIGGFGMLEPRLDQTKKVTPQEIDCAVLPALAFDRSGKRLGRGGGYFDKVLANIRKGVPRIGLAFEFQVMNDIPTDVHDQPIDHLISS